MKTLLVLNFQFSILANASLFLNENWQNKHPPASLDGALFLFLTRNDFTRDREGLKSTQLSFGSSSSCYTLARVC